MPASKVNSGVWRPIKASFLFWWLMAAIRAFEAWLASRRRKMFDARQ